MKISTLFSRFASHKIIFVSLFLLPVISHTQTPADSVTITFRTYKPSSPTVFVPGQFNNWSSNGAISQMTYDGANGSWQKKYIFKIHDASDSRRTLGDSVFEYKFNQGGTSGGWYSDPLNPEQNSSDNNNSVLRLNKIFWFEVNLTRTGNRYSSVGAGLVHDNSASVSSILLVAGLTEETATTTDITSSYNATTSLLDYTLPSSISDSSFVRLIAVTNHGDSAVSFNPPQYPPHTPYLDYPDVAIPYVDSCAVFWLRAADLTYGGIYTNVDRFGNVITSSGLNKNLVAMSRDAYGFSRAYMLTGNELYLSKARNILDFMYQHHWDGVYGGWHSTIDRVGNATSSTENKTAFDQLYALVGIAAYCEATYDTLDWRYLLAGYQSNEDHLWDTSAQNFGYYDYGTYNWQTRSGKSFNATVDAITTHMLGLYLMTGEDRYKIRLQQLARNVLDHLVASMDFQSIGFAEHYYTNWTYDNNTANYNTRTEMGHVLKTAWCLARLQQILPDSAYLPAAEKLATNVLTKGYDQVLGGPYKDFDRVTGQMLMYGQADTGKAWWQMEQAMMAGLMLYDLTYDEKYFNMANGSVDFFMNYFVDHQYSEVYADRTRRGGPMGGLDKGNSGKAAYHSIETGYYIYLYGNLILHHQPATLHYRIAPDTSDRTIRMNPIALATDRYRIREVHLDGNVYSDFNATSRLLHIPPGTGGHFVVVYEPTPTSVAESSQQIPANFSLNQNYPNPFNPVTRIEYELPRQSAVTLKVFDILGREISTLVNELQAPGHKSTLWDASHLPSGVYFYRLVVSSSNPLQAGNFITTKKMILAR